MLLLIVSVLILLVMVLASIRIDTSGQRPRLALRSPGLLVLGVGLAVFGGAFADQCFLTVPAAHVAAVYDPLRGGVQSVELPEGFHFVLPWWQTQLFRVQTQEYTMSKISSEGAVIGDDSIHCQTNEGLGLNLDVTVLFHIDPKDAHSLWRKVGEDYQRILVRPYARNVIRMVIARYSVVDVYGNLRQKIEQEITDRMRRDFQEKGIALESVLLRNVEFANREFAEAITQKQVAQQQINTEAQNLRRATFEKETLIAEARGEAEAISKRGAMLRANPEVVQYEMAQKLAPQVRSLYLPSSVLPLRAGQGGK
jgi:regulator of protease activity HflC (stomatin/prohibitin superfamily)